METWTLPYLGIVFPSNSPCSEEYCPDKSSWNHFKPKPRPAVQIIPPSIYGAALPGMRHIIIESQQLFEYNKVSIDNDPALARISHEEFIWFLLLLVNIKILVT